MAGNLREKTVSGMLWSSVGKFGTLALTFVSNLVLARLLMPSDYGCIGMLQVFISISGIFVTAGFGSALIQKKHPTHIDYTSVFYWNLVAAIVFYFVLYFTGPAIARFYAMPELCSVLRVQSLSLIINAFSTVQSNQLQKQLRFKQLSIRNIIASFIGTIVAITMAFMDMGVWSLVANSLVSSFIGVLLLWKMSSWRPTFEFSWQSLRELFSFGGLMALSAFVETIYTNLQSLIIGKYYSANDLGYYTQAKKLEEVPTTALSQVVNDVSFPVFSSIQDDRSRLLLALRKNVKSITFLTFPLMVLLLIIAEPLLLLLYGERWLVSVPYFQILCVSSMVYTLNTLNTNVIKSLGKSKVYFFVQLSKRLIGIVLIVFGAMIGIYGLLWAVSALGYICVVINMGVNKRLIDYGYWKQIKDIGVYYLTAVFIGILVYFGFDSINMNIYVRMLLMIVCYSSLYLGISYVLKFEGFQTYMQIIKTFITSKL